MKSRWCVIGVAAVAFAVMAVLNLACSPKQQSSRSPAVGKTSWGEPDLRGLWSDEEQVPLQRSPRFASREFLTDEEVKELNEIRAGLPGFGEKRAEQGTEKDLAGAYNSEVYQTHRKTGSRTSMIIEPPDGRLPAFTPEVLKRQAELREWSLDLIRSTEACKNKWRQCAGGKYNPVPSTRFDDAFKYYPVRAINRVDNPEDPGLGIRCLGLGPLPDLSTITGNVRAIFQSPKMVTIFYDTGQGEGWHRIIPVDGSPHLPDSIRLWKGDSRGHWEGDMLVVDVTNFSPKTEFYGSRQKLHLVERWKRTGPDTIENTVTMDDPTTWTAKWTITRTYSKQSDQHNRVYKEPRCHEGNNSLTSSLAGARVKDKEFALGRGPDPRTMNNDADTLAALDDSDLDPVEGLGGGGGGARPPKK